jgi:hypothetical protein
MVVYDKHNSCYDSHQNEKDFSPQAVQFKEQHDGRFVTRNVKQHAVKEDIGRRRNLRKETEKRRGKQNQKRIIQRKQTIHSRRSLF